MNPDETVTIPQEIGSTLAKERMVNIIAINGQAAKDAQVLLEVLNANPGLDEVFCRLFNIQPILPNQPVR